MNQSILDEDKVALFTVSHNSLEISSHQSHSLISLRLVLDMQNSRLEILTQRLRELFRIDEVLDSSIIKAKCFFILEVLQRSNYMLLVRGLELSSSTFSSILFDLSSCIGLSFSPGEGSSSILINVNHIG